MLPQQLPALTRRQAAALKLASAIASTASAWTLRCGDRLQLWQERRRQRRALGSVSDHMLKDMGLSRGEIGCELGKRFWEA
jgi:uncharacterized protein YjiS (DUF1127 family)